MEVLDSVANTEKEMSLAALTEVTLFPTYLLLKKINVFIFTSLYNRLSRTKVCLTTLCATSGLSHQGTSRPTLTSSKRSLKEEGQ